MKTNKHLITFLANFFIPLAGISTDIYLPSLPALCTHFDVMKASVQLTVTFFAAGMGFMQFIAGPVSDALGRKKLILASTIIQLIMTILIIFAPSITWMIVYRFIQGSAAGFLIVPARAILNDTFEGNDLKKQFNYLTISFALGPILGPFIGGYLQHYAGWQANFIFIAVYALIVILFALFVYNETIPAKKQFSSSHLWHNYAALTKIPFFLICCIFTACLFAYTAFFNVAGPFLVEERLNQTPIVFGHMALLIGLAWFLGNVTNRTLFHMNPIIKVTTGLLITLFAAIALLIMGSNNVFTLAAFVTPMFFMIMMSGGIFSLFVSECLSMAPQMAASANGFLFGTTWTAFSIFSVIAAFTKSHTLIPIASSLLGACILCLLLFLKAKKVLQTIPS